MNLPNEIMNELGALWRLTRTPELIRHNQNAVYSAASEDGEVIIRLTDTRHRSYEMLAAELDWMTFLADGGMNVCSSIPSENGKAIEGIALGNYRDGHAIVFKKAEGRPVDGLDEVDDPLAFRWGVTLGKMHALSQSFRPRVGHRMHVADPGIQSLVWHTSQLSDPPARLSEMIEWVDSLSKEPSAYGLIHSDFQPDNFFHDDSEIYPFDFDDCCYHWRAADIAYALYSIYFDVTSGNGDLTRYHAIREQVVAGFVSEFPAIAPWLEDIDRFLQYRIALLYCWCRNAEHVPHWMNGITDEWRKHLQTWSREQIAEWE